MNKDTAGEGAKVLVIPCSGIGKVHGLMTRESAYLVVDEFAPAETEVVCLALLVKEDADALAKVKSRPCITIDGCGKACAQKNVVMAGGQVVKSLQIAPILSSHRGIQLGNASELSEDGWAVTREIAAAVAREAARIQAVEEVA